MQGDVSFTFLDRIEEVELNIVDRRWQSALALALTLPDICGERCWQLRCEYLHQNKGFYSGTIEIPNLKGEQSIGKKSGKYR